MFSKITNMMSLTTAGLLGLLFPAPIVSASFTADCRNVCLAFDNPNILVTECTVDGGTTDTQYQWSQIDLNSILGFNAPDIVYQSGGNYALNNYPCDLCSLSDGVIACDCAGDVATLDLNTYIDDVTGTLCFANNAFGPVCGTSTTRTC